MSTDFNFKLILKYVNSLKEPFSDLNPSMRLRFFRIKTCSSNSCLPAGRESPGVRVNFQRKFTRYLAQGDKSKT